MSDELKVNFTKCKHNWVFIWEKGAGYCNKCDVPKDQWEFHLKALQDARREEREKYTYECKDVCSKQSEEISALKKENEKLVEALNRIKNYCCSRFWIPTMDEAYEIAKQALLERTRK